MKKAFFSILLLIYIIGGFAQNTVNFNNSTFSICLRIDESITLSFDDVKIDTNAKLCKRHSSIFRQANEKVIIYVADITEKQMLRLRSLIPADLQNLPVEGDNYQSIDGNSYQLQIQLGNQIYYFYDTPEPREIFKPLIQYIEELEKIKFRKIKPLNYANNITFCFDK